MNWTIQIILTLVGQLSTVPYDDFTGPSFSNVSGMFSYEGAYSSIRKIDFRNFTVHFFEEKGESNKVVRLKQGGYELRNRYGYSSVTLESVKFLTPIGAPGSEYALLLMDFSGAGGSSSQSSVAQVFRLSGGRLQLIQQMETDKHFDTTHEYYSFTEATNELVMRTAHYMPGDAHCCVSAMDVVTLRWNGSRFVQTSINTELTDYGKNKGKRLNP